MTTKQLKTLTAAKVIAMRIPKPRWAVEELIPEGLTILAGNPKVGKSFLALGASIDVSLGRPVLGSIPCKKGSVLYLALEDPNSRLQRRLKLLLGKASPPINLHLVTECPRLTKKAKGLAFLRRTMAGIRDLTLVVIDTFERVRIPFRPGGDRYREDYRSVIPLKRLAEKSRVAIVVIHHDRKAEATDQLSKVSGTHGLTAAADGVLMLRIEPGRHDAVLYVRGRDTVDRELALKRDRENGSWKLLGNAALSRLSSEQAAIIEVLNKVKKPMTVKSVSRSLKKDYQATKMLMWKMGKKGVLLRGDKKYSLPSNFDNQLS